MSSLQQHLWKSQSCLHCSSIPVVTAGWQRALLVLCFLLWQGRHGEGAPCLHSCQCSDVDRWLQVFLLPEMLTTHLSGLTLLSTFSKSKTMHRSKVFSGTVGPGKLSPLVVKLSVDYGVPASLIWGLPELIEKCRGISARPHHGYCQHERWTLNQWGDSQGQCVHPNGL